MIIIEKWAGLVTNASPYALPPGAAVTQVNAQVLNPGQLVVRYGNTTVSWSTGTAGASPVVRIFRSPSRSSERVVFQNTAGTIYVMEGPA